MLWYEGGIAQAIAASKANGAIFVVYVEGSDDKSKKITTLINTPEVSNKLSSDSFVAIKLEANSLSHQQFAEIYKQVTVPSIFFIGKTGLPLEIVTDVENSSALSEKINLVLQKGGMSVPTKENAAKLSEDLIKSEQKPPPNVICENGVCTLKKDESEASSSKAEATPSSEGEAPSELSPEEKVKRAKELVEQQRLLKEKEEEEKEKQKEIERRKMGQSVQQLKKWQEDQEFKQLVEEREKEKRENQAARDRVLAQIAQDKAERAARFSTSPPVKSTPKPSSPPVERKPVDHNVAKLQFKLPDGSTHTHEFNATDTLENVRSYVVTSLGFGHSFTLATAFPRREFTPSNNSETLKDLELVPNAVLLVLRPTGNAVTSAHSGGLTAMIWALFTPFFNLFGYLKNMIFGSNGSSEAAGSNSGASSSGEHKRPSSDRNDPQSSYQVKRMKNSTVVKRHGNIHRLSDRTDSDDENNTWNGNSTQQM